MRVIAGIVAFTVMIAITNSRCPCFIGSMSDIMRTDRRLLAVKHGNQRWGFVAIVILASERRTQQADHHRGNNRDPEPNLW